MSRMSVTSLEQADRIQSLEWEQYEAGLQPASSADPVVEQLKKQLSENQASNAKTFEEQAAMIRLLAETSRSDKPEASEAKNFLTSALKAPSDKHEHEEKVTEEDDWEDPGDAGGRSIRILHVPARPPMAKTKLT